MKYKLTGAFLAVLSLTACPTTHGPHSANNGPSATASPATPTTANAKTDCGNVGKIVSTVLGVVIGDRIGKELGGTKGRDLGRLLGGAGGYLIGANYDNKKCELAKIADKYKVPIQTSPIQIATVSALPLPPLAQANKPTTEVPPFQPIADSTPPLIDRAYQATPATNEKIDPQTIVGTTVQVGDPDGEGHFSIGSDQLTPRARGYFAEIARQYIPGANTDKSTSVADRAKMEQIDRSSKILLVGHTDDTGSSTLNASLAERRAKNVAAFLASQGVPTDMLYFQGAGESHPIADNSTDQGRNRNRRVEIVQLADETSFKKYVQQRTPNYAFYRKVDASNRAATTQAQASPVPSKNDVPRKESSVESGRVATAANPRTNSIDFGGQPLTKSYAINVGLKNPGNSPFSFISNAFASETPPVATCADDRPRASGSVKSLRTGERYATVDFLPALDRNSWVDTVNGHFVALNSVGVLKDGSLANAPELLVYKSYKDNKAKPDSSESPQVNTYKGERGLLYRVFANGQGGLRCMDLVFPPEGGNKVQQGWLVYEGNGGLHQSSISPRLIPNNKGRI
jgi:outer membrane protein OmpA-like peptidoglycan-associated protein